MAFDAKAYEDMKAKLAEMKALEGFDKYAETKKAERKVVSEEADAIFKTLKQKRVEPSRMLKIASKLRGLVNAAEKAKQAQKATA